MKSAGILVDRTDLSNATKPPDEILLFEKKAISQCGFEFRLQV
jgi:hypothetical protein